MRNRLLQIFLVFFMISLTAPILAGENKDIILPKRPSSVNVDLVTALEKRKSTREYTTKKLSLETPLHHSYLLEGMPASDFRICNLSK